MSETTAHIDQKYGRTVSSKIIEKWLFILYTVPHLHLIVFKNGLFGLVSTVMRENSLDQRLVQVEIAVEYCQTIKSHVHDVHVAAKERNHDIKRHNRQCFLINHRILIK